VEQEEEPSPRGDLHNLTGALARGECSGGAAGGGETRSSIRSSSSRTWLRRADEEPANSTGRPFGSSIRSRPTSPSVPASASRNDGSPRPSAGSGSGATA
jgi:hypothetical protein